MEGEESLKCIQLSLECMSEESSDSEQEDMVVHKPAWRSRDRIFSARELRGSLFIIFIYFGTFF